MAKIAVLTNFKEINYGYSLTGVVADQVEMLAAYDHDVTVFLSEVFDETTLDPVFESVARKYVIPDAKLVDYRSQKELGDLNPKSIRNKSNHANQPHYKTILDTRNRLKNELKNFDLCITHDWCFTGWNLPYFLGLRWAAEGAAVKFLHWIHSVPMIPGRDWWKADVFGPNHTIVFPNFTDIARVMEAYCTTDAERVQAIHHIRDPRNWYDFSPVSNAIIKRMPGMLHADIVQILPASCDRLLAKGLKQVVGVFGALKRMRRTVCLLCVNQWAHGRGGYKEELKKYYDAARQAGLKPGVEFEFTSNIGFPLGVDRREIRDLFTLSNVFIFPTISESWGLVVPEAALAGVLFVGNKSLAQQYEVAGSGNGLFYDYGSYHYQPYFDDIPADNRVAADIINALDSNHALRLKTFARQRYNRDAIYNNFYKPIISKIEKSNKIAA